MSRPRKYKQALVEYLLSRTYGGCGYCGAPLTADTAQIDHQDPFGPDAVSNYLPACAYCNASKGQRTKEEYRKSIEAEELIDELPELGWTARQAAWLASQDWFPIKGPRHIFWHEDPPSNPEAESADQNHS